MLRVFQVKLRGLLTRVGNVSPISRKLRGGVIASAQFAISNLIAMYLFFMASHQVLQQKVVL